MIPNIEGRENLQVRLYWLSNRLTELQSILAGMAELNANLTGEGVMSARMEFGMTQLEIIIRNKQVQDLANGFEMRSVSTLLDEVPSNPKEERAWIMSDQSVELRAAQALKSA